jgi:eukaryotic-like serine/threonine-protein kinase
MPVTDGVSSGAGRSLGKYTLLGRLAQGGMGEILLACLRGDGGFEKYVVIKRLRRHLDEDQGSVQAFLDEARIVARISHPNVCQVHELGMEDGRYYLAMEYLEGLPLSGLVRRANRDRAPLDLRAVAGLVEQACEGLHHVHNLRHIDGTPAAVLHRDVSPQNLFVRVDGILKILDFGIAKTGDSSVKTPTGRIKGKSAYMSPEQIRGQALDARSDIYSLGVVLYEAITGQPLFQRADVEETFRAIREDTLPFLRDVPGELNAVIQRAVAREREERFASARALGHAIGEAVGGLGGSMAAPQLAEWLEQRFADDLRERRERVAQAISARARTGPLVQCDGRLEPGTVLSTGVSIAPLVSTAGAAPSTVELMARSDELWSDTPARAEDALLARGPVAGASSERQRRRVGTWSLAGVLGAVLAGAAIAILATRGPAVSRAAPARLASAPGGSAPIASPVAARAPAPDSRPEIESARDAAPPAAPVALRAAAKQDGPAPRARKSRRSAPVASGYFTIDSRPYAAIHVDGVRRGVTPLLRMPLAPGAHSVVAVTADGRRQSLRVTIEPGAEAPRRRLDW